MLLTEGIIDEVLGQLKSGKEADVWLVRRAEEILAAKIYKEREHRSFKNNAEYKEGRQVRNTRTQRAMAKGSKFGRESDEAEWKAAEADALFKLHATGARVPRPVMFFEGVLLMDVVVDPEGHAAPRLVDASIPPEKGMSMYEDLRCQAVKLLCADLIHGDLSEFNVLLAWDGPTIIDFPQVISAAQNSRAEHFFKRDIDNLRRFFATLDPAVGLRESDADEIWRAYVRRDLTADFVPTGRAIRKPQAPQSRNRHPQARPAGTEVSYRGRPTQAVAAPQGGGQRQPQQQGRQPQRQPGQSSGAQQRQLQRQKQNGRPEAQPDRHPQQNSQAGTQPTQAQTGVLDAKSTGESSRRRRRRRRRR